MAKTELHFESGFLNTPVEGVKPMTLYMQGYVEGGVLPFLASGRC